MKELEIPGPSPGDRACAIVRALLSAIPYAGGAAVELFTALIAPPLESRRQEWMKNVGEILQELQDSKGLSIDQLRDDKGFIDTVLHASNIALRTSQDEKRHILLNAIVNTALQHEPDESLRQIFLEIIDVSTVWHLRILKLFQDPKKWAETNKKPFPAWDTHWPLYYVLEHAYPELSDKGPLYEYIWKDLESMKLIEYADFTDPKSSTELFSKRTSYFGDQFLSFIEVPV